MQFSYQTVPVSIYVKVRECFAPWRAAALNIHDLLETLRIACRPLQNARARFGLSRILW